MAACMPMGISDPESTAPRLQLFLCPLPLKVSASCGGGHSKWAYISYWDLGRIEQKLNWAQLNRIQGFRQTYCDNRSHYLKLLCHSYFMNLCRVCARVQLRIVPHSMPQSTARYHYNNIGVLISSKFSIYHNKCATLGYRMSHTWCNFVEGLRLQQMISSCHL